MFVVPYINLANQGSRAQTGHTPVGYLFIYEGESISNQLNLFSVEIHLFFMPSCGGAYCFWVVRPTVHPFVTLFDAEHNFRTVNATVLKFHIWIPHEKIVDTYFLS